MGTLTSFNDVTSHLPRSPCHQIRDLEIRLPAAPHDPTVSHDPAAHFELTRPSIDRSGIVAPVFLDSSERSRLHLLWRPPGQADLSPIPTQYLWPSRAVASAHRAPNGGDLKNDPLGATAVTQELGVGRDDDLY